ncbi:MAG: carbohydrate kinase [Alphaproteobacteria bacterium]|nr:carbohydrate kinase [Alphaproteobacteria bacterium]
MSRIVAIDSGLTVTKAVVFDLAGRQLGVARRHIEQLMPEPRKVEREMLDFWRQTASAIQEVLAITETLPKDVVSVSATAHGDGIYLLDNAGDPLGNGILSLDSRAEDQVQRWQSDGTSAASLTLTGQVPHVSAPSSLLAWIRETEPERFDRIGHVLACKDWLRYCLTGSIGTDCTEASTSFTDVNTQRFSSESLSLFGLDAVEAALPAIAGSAEIIGNVTDEAALATGLAAGTPVAAGLHDVTASALGIGGHTPDVVGIVAGTYSINECVSLEPRVGKNWFCRNAVQDARWNNMSISPASATNYDWFLDTLCAAEKSRAEADGTSIHDLLAPEIEEGLGRASSVIYHPYLFGSPFGPAPSAGFVGLRGWHKRGDLLAALLEGIAFNHRFHVDVLRAAFGANTARLTGGISRSTMIAQLFADILNMPITVTETDEAAAWGAALCAGASVGAFESVEHDPRDLPAISTEFKPDPARAAHYDERYAAYVAVGEDLAESQERLNALDVNPGGRS